MKKKLCLNRFRSFQSKRYDRIRVSPVEDTTIFMSPHLEQLLALVITL
jgi:hypothetical protein